MDNYSSYNNDEELCIFQTVISRWNEEVKYARQPKSLLKQTKKCHET